MIEKIKNTLDAGNRRFTVKGAIAVLVFGAIIVVFGAFGLNTKDTLGGDGAAASVNKTRISIADFRSEAQRLEQMYAPMFGGNFGGEAQRQQIQSMALESLINQELVHQAAQNEGIYATDAEVREFIFKDVPAFQKDGKFKSDVYFQLLEANRLSATDFEEKVRKDKTNQRSRHVIELAAAPLGLEQAKSKELKENKLNISFAKVDKEAVEKNMMVADSEIKEALAKPEFLKKVEDYYKANKPEFTTEAQVKAQHILIKTDAQDPESDAKAKAKMDEIKKRLAKEDFAKVAKETSEDPGSKMSGGDLGWFGKGRMVPEFELAAFSQKIGVIGEPIKSNFGYHILKVNEKKEGTTTELEAAKPGITKKLLIGEKYDGEIKKLEEALAKSDVEAVDKQLKVLGANWDETGFFELGADQIPKLASEAASLAAFEVSEKAPLLPKLVRDAGQKFVIKFKAAKKETVPDVEKQFSQVGKERSYDLFAKWVDQQKKTARIERNERFLSR